MLQRLLMPFAQIKLGNTSENQSNYILLSRVNETNKKV